MCIRDRSPDDCRTRRARVPSATAPRTRSASGRAGCGWRRRAVGQLARPEASAGRPATAMEAAVARSPRARWRGDRPPRRGAGPGAGQGAWSYPSRGMLGATVIIGMGGLGCPAAVALAQAGARRLTLVDGDVVELSLIHISEPTRL